MKVFTHTVHRLSLLASRSAVGRFGLGIDGLWLGILTSHLDPAGLGFLAFWQTYMQNAIFKFSLGAFSRNSLRQRKRAGKRAVRALDAMVISLIRFSFKFSLAL